MASSTARTNRAFEVWKRRADSKRRWQAFVERMGGRVKNRILRRSFGRLKAARSAGLQGDADRRRSFVLLEKAALRAWSRRLSLSLKRWKGLVAFERHADAKFGLALRMLSSREERLR